MKNPTDHIQKHAHTVRLTAEEREHMKMHLLAHMRAHPLQLRSPYLGILSPFQRGSLRPLVFAIALLLMVGGTTAFAAEGALPGDTLYPLKVNVVEPAVGAFQISDEAKAAWRVHLLDTRLSEASDLATKEDLNTSDATALSDRIAATAEDASVKLNTLNQHDPNRGQQLSAELEATIEVHAPALLRLDAALTASSAASSTVSSTSPAKRERSQDKVRRTMTLPPNFLEGLPGHTEATTSIKITPPPLPVSGSDEPTLGL